MAGWNELERGVFTAQQWCSVEELQSTTEVVFPVDLAHVLPHLIDDRQAP